MTIFALSTAAGRAGVAIIRISGSEAENALLTLCDKLPEPRIATLTKISIDNEIIDRGLLLWFPAPYSFTGEDVAELHIHGSHAVVSRIIRHLSSLENCRMAEAGEFSRRAFENEKMDLTSLEGLSDLIDAETEIQRKQAIRQMSGDLEKLYENWRKEMLAILSQVEAYIDFPDEDLPEDLKINERITSLKKEINKHLENKTGEILRGGVHVAIIGATNVGKSSLLNYLVKRDAAIVSETAGTTRDIIEVHLDIAGYPMILSDTAGLRENTSGIESEGIKRTLKKAAHADMKICMFDATSEPDKSTLSLIDSNTIVVVNKKDLCATAIVGDAVYISVTEESGIEKLMEILEIELSKRLMPSNEPLLTRERHRSGLEECVSHLKRSLKDTDIELISENLRIAGRSIGKITGKIEVEEILTEIFSNFCIGK